MVISRDSIFAEFNDEFACLDDYLIEDEDLVFLNNGGRESDTYMEDIDELDAPIGKDYDDSER